MRLRRAAQGYKPPEEGPSEYQTIPLDKVEDFGVHCKQYYSLDVSFFKSSLDSHLLDLLWNKYWVNALSSNPLFNTRDLVAGQLADIGGCEADSASGALRAPRCACDLCPPLQPPDAGMLPVMARRVQPFAVCRQETGGCGEPGRQRGPPRTLGVGGEQERSVSVAARKWAPAVPCWLWLVNRSHWVWPRALPSMALAWRPCPAEEGKLEAVVRDTARVAAEQIKGLSTQVIKELLFNRRCRCGGQAAAAAQGGGAPVGGAPTPMESG